MQRNINTKIFLDDVRTVQMVYPNSSSDEFVVLASFNEFVEWIEGNGLPSFISFDNDLGTDENGEIAPDGYSAAKWLVFEKQYDISPLEYKIHSANPIAAENIKCLLDNYKKHLQQA